MERDKAGVGDRMITVKCGYEGCDWEKQYEGSVIVQGVKCLGNASLLKHYVEIHNVPPAIWER